MNRKELFKFVKEQLDAGVSESLLRKKLKSMDFSEKISDEVISLVLTKKEIRAFLPEIKLNVLFGIIVVVILVAAGAFVFINPDMFGIAKKTAVQAQEQNTQANTFREPTQQEIDLLKKAAETNDTSYCKDIEEHNLYYDCMSRIWEINDCRYDELLGDDIDMCFYGLADEKMNISYCRIIKNPDKNLECINKLLERSIIQNSCQNLMEDGPATSLYIDCIVETAKNKRDPILCDSIEDGVLSRECKMNLLSDEDIVEYKKSNSGYSADQAERYMNALLFSWAINYERYGICDLIMESEKTEVPLEIIQDNKLSANTATIKEYCKFIITMRQGGECDSSFPKNLNMLCSALKSKDLNICSQIADKDLGRLCISKINLNYDCRSLANPENMLLCGSLP